MSDSPKFLQDTRPNNTEVGRMSDFEFWACIVIVTVAIIIAIGAVIVDKTQNNKEQECIEHGLCE